MVLGRETVGESDEPIGILAGQTAQQGIFRTGQMTRQGIFMNWTDGPDRAFMIGQTARQGISEPDGRPDRAFQKWTDGPTGHFRTGRTARQGWVKDSTPTLPD